MLKTFGFFVSGSFSQKAEINIFTEIESNLQTKRLLTQIEALVTVLIITVRTTWARL